MKKVLFLFITFILFGIQLWGENSEDISNGYFELLCDEEIKIIVKGLTKHEINKKEKWIGTIYYDYFYVGKNGLQITTEKLKDNIILSDNKNFNISPDSGIKYITISYTIPPQGGPSSEDVAAAASSGQSISGPQAIQKTKDLYFIYDFESPKIPSVNFSNKSDNDWYNPDKNEICFLLSGGEDAGSGHNHYEYKLMKPGSDAEFICCQNSFTFPEMEDGQYIISFYSVDNVGNKSIPASYNINLDTELPVFEDNLIIGTEQNYVKNANIHFSVSDDNLNTCKYRIYQNKGKDIPWTAVTVTNGIAKCETSYDKHGISTIEINASDKAGNFIEKQYTMYVDSEPPQITVKTVNITDGNQKTIISINAIACEDNKSGINSFKIDEKNIEGNYIKEDNSPVEQKVENFFSSEINRGKTITNKSFKLIADDICGNETPLIINFTKIPKRLVLSTFTSSIDGEYIVNKIKTNLNSKNEIDSYKLSFSRTFTESETAYIQDYVQEQNKVITVIQSQTVLENDSLYIIDKIPVSTGMGHHEVKYSFKCKTMYSYKIGDEDEKSNDFDDEIDTNALTNTKCYCANNPCKITWKITGKKQGSDDSTVEPYSLEIDGRKSFEVDDNNPIYTNPNGSITISVKIQDFDCEKHDIQLYKYLYLSNNGEDKNKSTLFKIPVEKMVINNYPTYKLDNSGYRTDGYYEFSIPIYLRYNILENYGLEVVEFVDDNNSNQVVTKTEKVALKTDNPDFGGFKLNVLPDADYSANGISLQVNTQLKIIIEETDNSQSSYIFDWGDKKYSTKDTINDKETASHIYGQKEGRTGAISEYLLNISTKRSSNSQAIPNEIKIYAIDTQYGELAGNEIWIGKHEILSSITIPEEFVLTIDGSVPITESDNKVQILCYGNPDISETSEGLTTIYVKGQLKTEKETDGIIFIEMHNLQNYGYIANISKSYGWGGIVAYPNSFVSLSNSVINFANRGIITQAESKVTIMNSFLQFNDIGIHAFPGATITVNNTEISNNSIYGIKEEQASKNIVILTDKNNLDTNRIENNGSSEYPRNHYKATTGLEY